MDNKQQQITFPLDPISTQIIQKDLPVYQAKGTFDTQVVNVIGGKVTVAGVDYPVTGAKVTVPVQPSGTIKVKINGIFYELLIK